MWFARRMRASSYGDFVTRQVSIADFRVGERSVEGKGERSVVEETWEGRAARMALELEVAAAARWVFREAVVRTWSTS